MHSTCDICGDIDDRQPFGLRNCVMTTLCAACVKLVLRRLNKVATDGPATFKVSSVTLGDHIEKVRFISAASAGEAVDQYFRDLDLSIREVTDIRCDLIV